MLVIYQTKLIIIIIKVGIINNIILLSELYPYEKMYELAI